MKTWQHWVTVYPNNPPPKKKYCNIRESACDVSLLSLFFFFLLTPPLLPPFLSLSLSAPVEAVHLANLLCQFGYYFPVNELKNLIVKDDSSLYRFQVGELGGGQKLAFFFSTYLDPSPAVHITHSVH